MRIKQWPLGATPALFGEHLFNLEGKTVPNQRTLGAALALLGLLVTTSEAALEASLDRSRVTEGEAVVLRLAQGGDDTGSTPDLSPLAMDFEVVGTAQSQSFTMSNGHIQQNREWHLTLMPRRSGRLRVPALQAGADRSEALALEVTAAGAPGQAAAARAGAANRAAGTSDAAAPQQADNGSSDLFVRATVDREKPFVNSDIIYTVRIYDGLGILEGSLALPAGKGLKVTPVGEGNRFEEEIGGQRYIVHEKSFRISPDAAGKALIEPITLEARVRDPEAALRRRVSPFGNAMMNSMFDRGRLVRVHSNPVTIEVRARPTDAGEGWFLPAESVTLDEEWIPATSSLEVGRAVTRLVRLRAKGASAAQLPQFEIRAPIGARQQETGSATDDQTDATGTAALMERRVTFVPSAAGTLEVPPVEVRWFDLKTNQPRVARLAGRTFQVAAAPDAPAPEAAALALKAGAGPASGAETGATFASDPIGYLASLSSFAERPGILAGTAAASALLAFGLSRILLGRRRRRAAASNGRPLALSLSTQKSAFRRLFSRNAGQSGLGNLRQACAANDATAARAALLAWARERSPGETITNPTSFARRQRDAALSQEIDALEAILFAPHASASGREGILVWSGASLWQAVSGLKRRRGRKARELFSPLPALYPE